MESLAAFGLACNILQTISFARETIDLFKQVFDEGRGQPAIKANAHTMLAFNRDLMNSLASARSHGPNTEAEHELQEVAARCLDASSRLVAELEKMGLGEAQGKRQIGKTVMIMARYCLKAGQLRKLGSEMQEYQNVMESGLLLKICTANQAADLRNLEEFENLDNKLQEFISGFAQDQVLMSQAIGTVSQDVKERLNNLQDEATCLRFLGSLKYIGMNQRRNSIKDQHSGTFEWIFKDRLPKDGLRREFGLGQLRMSDGNGSNITDNSSDEEPVPWDSFVSWLKGSDSSDNVYWISGKAGSGKSTLMLFLTRDDRTAANLGHWIPNTQILHHFLHCSGPPIQRNIKGIFCSLLYQLLDRDKKLISSLLQEFPTALSKDCPDDWSERELQDVTFHALQRADSSACIFLDGLDEILPSDGVDDLFSVLDKFKVLTNVKLCLSSRPELVLQRHLEKYPRLRLEVLTANDICQYTRDFLESCFTSQQHQEMADGSEFIQNVCRKADGVFLWVNLVLRDLRRGLTNKDSIAEMNQRLERTPQELHGLFRDMWERLGEDANMSEYLTSAARYFNLALATESRGLGYFMSVGDVMIATNAMSNTYRVSDWDRVSPDEIIRKCDLAKAHITTRCAGLLECSDDKDSDAVPSQGCQHTNSFRFVNTGVQFIHRAARDYLLYTNEGNAILQHDTSTYEDRLARLLFADMAVGKLWDLRYQRNQKLKWTLPYYLETLGRLRGFFSADRIKALLSLGWRNSSSARFDDRPALPFFGTAANQSQTHHWTLDLLIALSTTRFLDLVPSFLNCLGEIVTSTYTGYLVACAISDTRRLVDWNLEHYVLELIEWDANLNMRGLTAPDIHAIFADASSAVGNSAEGSHVGELYGNYQSLISRLVQGLYDGLGLNRISAILRIISLLVKKGVLLDIQDVFILNNSIGFVVALEANFWKQQRQSGMLIIKATSRFLLLEALRSMNSKPGSISWRDEHDTPPDLIQDLLYHIDSAEKPTLPSIVAFSPRGRERNIASLTLYRPTRSSQSTTIRDLLLVILKFMAPGLSCLSDWQDFWDYLNEIVHDCEATSMQSIQSQLCEDGFLVSIQDYFQAIPRLTVEQQESMLSSIEVERPFHKYAT